MWYDLQARVSCLDAVDPGLGRNPGHQSQEGVAIEGGIGGFHGGGRHDGVVIRHSSTMLELENREELLDKSFHRFHGAVVASWAMSASVYPLMLRSSPP